MTYLGNPLDGIKPPNAPEYGPFIDMPKRDPLVGNMFGEDRFVLLGLYNDPDPPNPHNSLIWFLFNPPNELFLAEAALVLFAVDWELVVVGRSRFPLNRLYGFETYDDSPPFCIAIKTIKVFISELLLHLYRIYIIDNNLP